MSIFKKKKSFVENELQALAIAIWRDVASLEYQGDSIVELVTIRYESGFRVVNVTGDSLLAIAKDVFAKID